MSPIQRNSLRFKVVWRIILQVAFSVAIVLYPLEALSQIERAIVREILNGEGVFIDDIPAKIDDVATFQQEVSTEESLVGLEFNNGAAGRLASYSSAIVGQCIEVRRGLLLASGPANGCTTTFEVGVQGTFYLLEVDDRGESQIKVLNGVVNILSLSSDADGAPQPITLREGERIAIDPAGVLGQIFPLSREEVEELLQDSLFRDFETELPGMKELQVSLERLYPGIPLPPLPGFKVLSPPPPPPNPPSLINPPRSPIPGLW